MPATRQDRGCARTVPAHRQSRAPTRVGSSPDSGVSPARRRRRSSWWWRSGRGAMWRVGDDMGVKVALRTVVTVGVTGAEVRVVVTETMAAIVGVKRSRVLAFGDDDGWGRGQRRGSVGGGNDDRGRCRRQTVDVAVGSFVMAAGWAGVSASRSGGRKRSRRRTRMSH